MSGWQESLMGDPQFLHAQVDQARDAVIVADRDGVIRLWSPGAEAMFAFSAQEAIGASLDFIVPARFLAAHQAGYRRAVETGRLRTEGRVLRTRCNHKHGIKLYVDFSFGLLKETSGAVLGVFAIGRDATSRQLEEAR
jgi:PAS domain S-box-containing protein